MIARILRGRAITRMVTLLSLAVPLVSLADFQMTNPVTGETESYTWKFVGTDTWNGTQYWRNSDGNNPSAVPGRSGSNRQRVVNTTVTGVYPGVYPFFSFYRQTITKAIEFNSAQQVQSWGETPRFLLFLSSKRAKGNRDENQDNKATPGWQCQSPPLWCGFLNFQQLPSLRQNPSLKPA